MNDRRALLKTALGGLLGLRSRRRLQAQPGARDPGKERPQEGDVFVHGLGDRKGEIVELDDVLPNSAQLMCYAKEPVSGVVRDGSRLNQVLLLRFDPQELSAATLALSAAGVVAYSGICPHTGCDVSLWRDETRNLLCSCHDSEFDPRASAVVTSGPAPRRLPSLPLAVENGVLKAAGGFSARIRFEREF